MYKKRKRTIRASIKGKIIIIEDLKKDLKKIFYREITCLKQKTREVHRRF